MFIKGTEGKEKTEIIRNLNIKKDETFYLNVNQGYIFPENHLLLSLVPFLYIIIIDLSVFLVFYISFFKQQHVESVKMSLYIYNYDINGSK